MKHFQTIALVIPLSAASTVWAQSNGGAPDSPAVVAVQARKNPPKCGPRIVEDFTPMTRTERAAEYARELIGPRAIIFTFVRAGANEGLNTPGEWGRNIRGYGYRLASSYSQHAISASFESGIALGLGEDNRYFASGEHGIGRRVKYVIESAFLARHDDGTRSLSYSAIAGPLAGAFISRGWQPDSNNSVSNALSSFGISIAIRLGVDTAREFTPRFLRKLVP